MLQVARISILLKKVTFVFRHFPLTQIHDKALLAAYAAEAAANQNKFWQMTDKLYDTQQTWEASNDPVNEFFVKYAKDLNLDINKFKADMNSDSVKKRVDEDVQQGNLMGLDSTPTFFSERSKG